MREELEDRGGGKKAVDTGSRVDGGSVVAFQGELMLASVDRDTVTFFCGDEPNPFKRFVQKKGMAGHRFMVVCAEINDDETAIQHEPAPVHELPPEGQWVADLSAAHNRVTDLLKKKARSNVAAILCGDKVFQRFCMNYLGFAEQLNEEESRTAILAFCGIKGRADLDGTGRGRTKFAEMLAVYQKWIREGMARCRS